jgi:Concanavalin A-like lectin/glucanases superfamily
MKQLTGGDPVQARSPYMLVYSSSFQNKWKHIAYTINGSTLTAFEDGLPLKTFTTTALKTTFTPTIGYIGHSDSNLDPINNAAFNDFRIYSTVLTNTQIMGLFYNM